MTRTSTITILSASLALFAARASAQDCAGGRVASDATEWHCCWPGQMWGPTERACIGPPTCPGGMVAHGEDCVAARAPSTGVLIQPVPAQPQPVQPIQPIQAAPAQPFVSGAPAVGIPGRVDVRVVPEGAPGWPSSPQAPTADVNPRFVTGAGDPGLIAAGTTLFLIGYLTSIDRKSVV